MPLSNPVPRRHIHTRRIECNGYEREDGLWDIEAHLVDTKSQTHARRAGGRERQPGEPVHDMWLRVTIDLDMKIHDVEARTDEGPYSICGDIVPNFKGLIGITIGAGWRKRIAESVGGVKGCTHMVDAARSPGNDRVPGNRSRAAGAQRGQADHEEALPVERLSRIQG
jgi:hypothetical protein